MKRDSTLNSTLFLYQRYDATSDSFPSTNFKFHSVPISTNLAVNIYRANSNFKFHSVPISTQSQQADICRFRNFKFHSVPISTANTLPYWSVLLTLNSTLFLYQHFKVKEFRCKGGALNSTLFLYQPLRALPLPHINYL